MKNWLLFSQHDHLLQLQIWAKKSWQKWNVYILQIWGAPEELLLIAIFTSWSPPCFCTSIGTLLLLKISSGFEQRDLENLIFSSCFWYFGAIWLGTSILQSCTSFFLNILWYSFTDPLSLENMCHNWDAINSFKGIVGTIILDWTAERTYIVAANLNIVSTSKNRKEIFLHSSTCGNVLSWDCSDEYKNAGRRIRKREAAMVFCVGNVGSPWWIRQKHTNFNICWFFYICFQSFQKTICKYL